MKYIATPLLLILSLFSQPLWAAEDPKVKMVTSFGEITLELYPQKAPETVKNFLQYVQDGYYTNTIFHRVINGFMIQGGGFTEDFERKEVRAPVKNEADNGLQNQIGTLAMARTSDPHSATAQFFINISNNRFLNFSAKNSRGWGYAVFGRVIDGMDVVNEIKSIPTGRSGPFPKDVPTETVVIESMTILE